MASKVSNPVLGLILAFFSHYLLDLPPQKEYSVENIKEKRWRKSFFDFLEVFSDIALGIALILLFSKNTPLIFAAAFSAIVPDGFTILAILFPQNKLLAKHQGIHKAINNVLGNKKIPPFWGIVSQILVIGAAIFFLL